MDACARDMQVEGACYRLENNFSESTVFSGVCDFVLFIFLFVSTITLERLSQSKPNFHT